MLNTRFACYIAYVAITFLFFYPRLTSQSVPAGCSFYNQPCQSVTAGICQSTDDVFESIPDNQVRNLAFLDVGNSGDRQIGLRYKTVDLPTNAIVKSAQIQFYGAFSSFNNGILNAQIDGEDLTQNSVTFTNMVGTVSNRPRTTANVVWPIPEYRVAANGEVVQTVDLTPIINEFLAEGWTQGDPEEPSVPAVILNLYDDAGTLIGTTTTDAEGRYYFSDSNVTGDIDSLTNYFIVLDASNFDANGNLNISGSFFGVLTDNDISTIGELDDNDSDALVPSDILSGLPVIDGVGVPYIPVSTGDFGCNDFSFDFGFFHCPVESCFSIVISRN